MEYLRSEGSEKDRKVQTFRLGGEMDLSTYGGPRAPELSRARRGEVSTGGLSMGLICVEMWIPSDVTV